MPQRITHPPKFDTLVELYEGDPSAIHLRFGQWFQNNFMPNLQNDTLYYCTNIQDSLHIINEYYIWYMWK